MTKIESLREEASRRGIPFSGNTSVATLEAKIAGYDLAQQAAAVAPTPLPVDPAAQANKLLRVRVLCRDPVKAGEGGTIIRVGNGVVGMIAKYVPFGEPWHIPQILYNAMIEAEMTYVDSTNPRSPQMRTSKLYDITVLPPLTAEEFEALAQQQAILNSSVGGA